jgi:16S rRNA processing protein RimM
MSAPAAGEEGRITLAAVAGAHGVKGEVRLKLFTDSARNLALHSQVFVGGTQRRLISVRDGGKTSVARFEGVNDRTGAEALRGSLVEIDRSALPPLEDGEYYHSDLIGLPCFDGEGTEIGRVSAVENFGAGDLLEVEAANGRKSLIAFKPGISDLESGRIVLDPDFLA